MDHSSTQAGTAGRQPISFFHSSSLSSAWPFRSLSGNASRAGGSKRDIYLKIIKRTLIIFAIGLFLNGFPYFGLAEYRIPGVLQRIAVCYFFASIIFLNAKVRTQVAITIALLVGYWLALKFIPAPGYAAGDLTKEGSLPSYIDRIVFGKHVWSQARVYDPEGLLSTIPAIATTMIGVFTGQWLRTEKTRVEKAAGMFVVGAICVAVGWAWNSFFPINKALWTSSYVLFTGGLALQFLALCYWLIDIKGYRRWAKPFEVFGMNAIALYVGAGLMASLFGEIKVGSTTLGGWIYAEPVCLMGVAHQRFPRIRNLVRFSLAGTDVDSLSTKNLPQGLNFFASSINRLFRS